MEEIIDPIAPNILIAELEHATFVRDTNKAKNKIYVTDAATCPMIMREIARLREISFRQGGGGSGKSLDMDEKDLMSNYKQLIVWSEDTNEIIGGYRFLMGKNATFNTEGQPITAMAQFFHFSQLYINEYLPFTLELGRAFVQPKYQSIKGGMKALYALDNLWDGIGAIVAENPDLKYLIGKVTVYSQTPVIARNAIIHYMSHYFEHNNQLIVPKQRITIPQEQIDVYNENMVGNDYNADFKWLNSFAKKHDSTIPPLFRAYIDLSNSLTSFGTIYDEDFGQIYDTGIMLTLEDIYNVKKERYIASHLKNLGLDIKRNFV